MPNPLQNNDQTNSIIIKPIPIKPSVQNLQMQSNHPANKNIIDNAKNE